MSDPVRLNKHLAHTLGISRREADIAISQGRVVVNGKRVELGIVVQPDRDKITLDENSVSTAKKKYTYLLMNKPVSYVCSRKQQDASPTIYALLPRQYHALKVAGRLDKDSCGLILLTDDGDTIFKLTHPKFKKDKVYHVALNKPLTPVDRKRIESGLELEDGISQLKIDELKKGNGIQRNRYQVIMHEGRNRQIRRTFKQLGYTVTFLERQSFGKYNLDQIKNTDSNINYSLTQI